MENLELRKFVAPEYVFGVGARELAGRYARNLGGTRALLVTDPGVEAAGWSAQVADSLSTACLEVVLTNRVTPNPRDHEVMTGAEAFLMKGCDLIVAVGGGSVIDCAKGIGLVAANECPIRDFEGVDKVTHPGPPLICVPTTSGTGADVSQFAIVTDCSARMKFAIVSKLTVPDVALVDPETTVTMDAYLTACTGMDALSHAVEAIFSTAHSPIYDLHATKAAQLVRQTLPQAVKNLQNLEFRTQMSLASLQAGLAFSNSSLGAVHAMAHSLGGQLDLPHGECNAMLLPHVVDFNRKAAGDRVVVLAQALGLSTQDKSREQITEGVVAFLSHFKIDVGLHRNLADHGVSETDISSLAKTAMADPCMVTNPRAASIKELAQVYVEAL